MSTPSPAPRRLILVLLACLLMAGLPGRRSVAEEARADPADLERSARALEQAISALERTYGPRYAQADRFRRRLAHVHRQGDLQALRRLERCALLAHPLLADHPLLLVTRHQYRNEHGTEATMCQTGQVNTSSFIGGAALRLLEVATGKITTLLEVPAGVVRDPEVHFDGTKILFSMRRDIRDDYHLYEIDADGSNLRQLTRAPHVSDIQPIYLPGGDIVFSSTRDPKYIPCQRHLMANLFRMHGDGSNIHQIGYNTQFEGRASLMPDGRILYTRWEYVDKHFAPAYGLWTVNPDGTDHRLYYGGYAWQPGTIVDARILAGTHRFVAVFTAPHELARGALVIADRVAGLDGLAPLVRTWPADLEPYMDRWDREQRIGNGYDSFRKVPVFYEDPYPLDEHFLLCVRPPQGRQGPPAIYLLDDFGHELLLHAQAPGCFDPMPLAPRPRPPVLADRVDWTTDHGTFYVHDVYAGRDMAAVRRGSVKAIRIVEAPPKRTWVPYGCGDWAPPGSADSHHPVAVNWNHYNTKRIIGTVPVEADGSAYFTVPAGRFVYFQLLDEQGMMIHSMRSGTMLQPGEHKGCLGCHDRYEQSLLPRKVSIALSRPPRRPRPWYGPPRHFSYTAEVQPVLDRYCISCHDYGKSAASLNLSGDRGILFNHSYVNLLRSSPSYYVRSEHENPRTQPLVSLVGAGPVKTLPPYSWGSHCSRLIRLLQQGHYGVKLDRESFDRLVTWIDLNGPYYPSHQSAYPTHTAGRSPLDHRDLAELGRLLLEAPGGSSWGWTRVDEYLCNQIGRVLVRHGPPVNFTRPAYSACLTVLGGPDSPAYRRALELIQKGRRNLAEHPRCDMPGFVPCAMHQAQLEHLRRRQAIEARNRRAIVRRDKVFD